MSRYAHVPEAVVEAWPELSFKAKAVVVALASHMNGRGECWPSRKLIREEAGLGETYTYGVTEATQELAAAGLLTVNRRGRHSCLYRWTEAVMEREKERRKKIPKR